jgi:hypothetical protein
MSFGFEISFAPQPIKQQVASHAPPTAQRAIFIHFITPSTYPAYLQFPRETDNKFI